METLTRPVASPLALQKSAGGRFEAMVFQALLEKISQVQLKISSNIEAVAVTINSNIFQNFTIFVIELLEDSKALYKPCSKFDGVFVEPRAVFLCNDGRGHFGDFVYIKDDRGVQEYLSLCEVQVFPFRSEEPGLTKFARVTVLFFR